MLRIRHSFANSKEKWVTVFCLVEAGAVGGIGMNSGGLGILGNFLETDRDRKQIGVPLRLIRRKNSILWEMANALKALISAKRTSSSNCLFGSKDGVAIDIEAAQKAFMLCIPKKGCWFMRIILFRI